MPRGGWQRIAGGFPGGSGWFAAAPRGRSGCHARPLVLLPQEPVAGAVAGASPGAGGRCLSGAGTRGCTGRGRRGRRGSGTAGEVSAGTGTGDRRAVPRSRPRAAVPVPARRRRHLRHQQRCSHHGGRRGHLLHRPPLPQHAGGAARWPRRLEPELHRQRSAPARTAPPPGPTPAQPPAPHPAHRPLPTGTRVAQGEPVFPEQPAEGADGVFPDGQPFPPSARGKRGKFVYVWWTWGETGTDPRRGPGGVPKAAPDPPPRTPPVPQGATGRWWTVPRPG